MITLLLALTFSTWDELPDGHVERWMQVTLRDDVVQIRYAVGFNDNTLKFLLADFGQKELPGDIESQLSLLQSFLEKGFEKSLQLRIDGAVSKLEIKSVEPSGRHHLRFFIDLEFPVPQFEESVRLEIKDRAFREYGGNSRYGLKTRGKLTVGESNVASMVARADKVDLSKSEKREAMTTVKATIEK